MESIKEIIFYGFAALFAFSCLTAVLIFCRWIFVWLRDSKPFDWLRVTLLRSRDKMHRHEGWMYQRHASSYRLGNRCYQIFDPKGNFKGYVSGTTKWQGHKAVKAYIEGALALEAAKEYARKVAAMPSRGVLTVTADGAPRGKSVLETHASSPPQPPREMKLAKWFAEEDK